MNRPGQPPQRPPSLAPPAGLSSQFRSPYPASQYSLPQRTYPTPTLQQQNTHRTPTVPQSPFLQTRQQAQAGSFPFGSGAGVLGQNGTSSMPPHMSHNPPAATPGTAPSASSASEVGFDPSEFPALGSLGQSAPANPPSSNTANTNSSSTVIPSSTSTNAAPGSTAASYATQAGQSGSTIPAVGTQARDFGPDDFPALGGQSGQQAIGTQTQPQTQNQTQNSESHPMSHPPGLNGFNDPHRTNLLGSLTSGSQQPGSTGLTPLGSTQQPGTPGMLNLRGIHPGFQTQNEPEKQRQNYAHKLNPAAHAAWNGPNTNLPNSQPNGSAQQGQVNQAQSQPPVQNTLGQPPQAQNQAGSTQPQSQSQPQHLNAPPGVPPPGVSPYISNGSHHMQHPHAPTQGHQLNPHNSLLHNPSQAQNSHAQLHSQTQHHPQTPAQQVLMSAADRWGLLGLLAMIKNAGVDADGGLSSVGTDLGAVGLDMGFEGNLYSTFITPWADQSAAHTVEPDFHLPSCYNVQPPPPGPAKASAFSDETLFFMFYSSPRDALQEVAAQELWNRNWRYHKDLRIWITKESGSAPSAKIPGGEAGTYTWWDPEGWGKERKEMSVRYADLEEKTVPAFVMGPGLVLAQPGQVASAQQTQGAAGQPIGQAVSQPRMQMAGV
ncbi:hypothetical protein BJ138DRAFT_1148133 [Hygrophoropsis aurantiaca]|uniref:Uncharacterized protein n=1 Tax=Hygrophoropsis aurantiaca TaxID=72124 RepID=A0ACB8AJ27_9AGAM|nr:hypothetical protein BJ138DRAFT_1148133 [Hygrophoropsis aurantiaca]